MSGHHRNGASVDYLRGAGLGKGTPESHLPFMSGSSSDEHIPLWAIGRVHERGRGFHGKGDHANFWVLDVAVSTTYLPMF